MTTTGSIRRFRGRLSPRERTRLSALVAAVVLLHALGWGLFFFYSTRYPALAGLGMLAYGFGLRHAFDADHIAAIDNTTRKMLADGGRPLGVGFFFSLGHATIVFALVVALALAAGPVHAALPALQHVGTAAGASISGGFLCIIGVLNLLVLADIVRIARRLRRGSYDEAELERRLDERGLMSRFLLGRVFRFVSRSWHMYPIGLLFGLGFDTATEVGLLAVAAGVVGNHLPILAILSLPLLFAAGMALMDTADGAFMSHAYGWAFSNPVRRVYYNLTVTTISVAVALGVGTVELAQAVGSQAGLHGALWDGLQALNLQTMGYAIVAGFAVAWMVALAIWKLRHVERRWTVQVAGATRGDADG